MDQKSWLWRKKSAEKVILATEKLNSPQKDNDEEILTLVADKEKLENELKVLNNKLASALSDCNSKDYLVKKHEKMALEAVVGREKAEAEAVSLKQELSEALKQRVASEERLTQLDAALKECMQQLRFVREEQEQRIHDAVMKTSKEFEISKKILEDQLAETSKRLTKLGVENSNLTKTLLAKEKLIDDLTRQRAQMETDFNALKARLESTEKDYASMTYEVRVLEKELEIRNEEREFNRRTAEASQKQHLESAKKIAKLESECQRLRLLVRKRLPGPAALAKMKNEVEMLERDSVEMRRKKLNSSPTSPGLDSALDNYSDSPSKKVNILIEQLCAMEEENKALKEALNKKMGELQFSRVMYSRTASKLSEVESQLEESSKNGARNRSTRNSVIPHEISLGSMSDVGSDDKASFAESWASALISELENVRNGQLKSSPHKTFESSEMNLMDDFAEMEKLALVSVDKPSQSSQASSNEANGTPGPLQTRSNGNSSEVMCKEIVLVPDTQSNYSISNNGMKSKSPLLGEVPDWLEDILKVILEHSRTTQRNLDDILEDIRKALTCMSFPNDVETFDKREDLDHPSSCDPSCISGYISWKPSNGSLKMDSSNDDADVNNSSEEKSLHLFHPYLSKSICRIIELIEGFSLTSPDYNIPGTLSEKKSSFSYKPSATPSGYMIRVFQWKTSELSAILQQFVRVCYELLNGKTDLNKFTQELTSALDWIINHCFSLQDVSSMRDAIKKQFDWDESQSECETETSIRGQFVDADKSHVTAPYDNSNFLLKDVREENKKLRDELINIEAAKRQLEDQIQSTNNRTDSLLNQLEDSERTIANLQAELDKLRKTKEMLEGKAEKQNFIDENQDKKLSLPKVEVKEASQKFPSENEKNYHEELEATCLDSVTEKETPNSEIKLEGNQLRTKQEITAASEKLAECQETILNLGKQLKALASPKDAALFDKVISTPMETSAPTSTTIPTPSKMKSISQRSSLLDQMIAEDNADTESPKAKEKEKPSSPPSSNRTIAPLDNNLVSNGNKHQEGNSAVKSLAIVPSKKQGGSLWKKLLWRKRKGNNKKTHLPFAP